MNVTLRLDAQKLIKKTRSPIAALVQPETRGLTRAQLREIVIDQLG
jgi:hypothetical protein